MTPQLRDKIDAAVSLIKETCARHQRPVVYASFGKDSMVMLALIAKAGLKLPVILHRESQAPRKYAFANRVIEKNDYEVHDWPPYEMQVVKHGEILDVVNHHQVGAERFDYLPIQIRPPREGEGFFCALKDFYLKPTGSYIFPWDLAFVGNKSCDVDRILGEVRLTTDFQDNAPNCSFAFPLRYFTNADIWEYTVSENLPIDRKRYNEKDGWKEHADDSTNPDWFTACTLCMSPDSPSEVLCPKTNRMIPNVSGMLRWLEAPRTAFKFMEQEQEPRQKEAANGLG